MPTTNPPRHYQKSMVGNWQQNLKKEKERVKNVHIGYSD